MKQCVVGIEMDNRPMEQQRTWNRPADMETLYMTESALQNPGERMVYSINSTESIGHAYRK